jgi:TPP-dependent 2-oxoacid decarboxylase
MIYTCMKRVYKFERFCEALRPSQFRKYVKGWDKSRYDEKFREFKGKYDGDVTRMPIDSIYLSRKTRQNHRTRTV